GGYLLQIVNIVDEDAVELIHLRINVARNGDIDEEHGPVAAAMQKSLAMLAAEDGVRRACRCDHDVGIAGDLVEPGEINYLGNDTAIEIVGHAACALRRAIRHQNGAGPL